MSDSYATIKLAANHSNLILVKTQPISAGNCNSIFIEFVLRTDDWLTCSKIRAVFNDYYIRSLDDNLKCTIPAEVLATPGQFEVGLCGLNGNIRLTTNKIEFNVNEGTSGGLFIDTEKDNDLVIYDGGDVNGY